ncbi:hypothetical protein Tcan_07539, partial [Toxocara canis]
GLQNCRPIFSTEGTFRYRAASQTSLCTLTLLRYWHSRISSRFFTGKYPCDRSANWLIDFKRCKVKMGNQHAKDVKTKRSLPSKYTADNVLANGTMRRSLSAQPATAIAPVTEVAVQSAFDRESNVSNDSFSSTSEKLMVVVEGECLRLRSLDQAELHIRAPPTNHTDKTTTGARNKTLLKLHLSPTISEDTEITTPIFENGSRSCSYAGPPPMIIETTVKKTS